eukprot:jgi/Pico_ML_1/52115/g2875.t1
MRQNISAAMGPWGSKPIMSLKKAPEPHLFPFGARETLRDAPPAARSGLLELFAVADRSFLFVAPSLRRQASVRRASRLVRTLTSRSTSWCTFSARLAAGAAPAAMSTAASTASMRI